MPAEVRECQASQLDYALHRREVQGQYRRALQEHCLAHLRKTQRRGPPRAEADAYGPKVNREAEHLARNSG